MDLMVVSAVPALISLEVALPCLTSICQIRIGNGWCLLYSPPDPEMVRSHLGFTTVTNLATGKFANHSRSYDLAEAGYAWKYT